MRGSASPLFRILCLVLVVSLSPGIPAWTQESQPKPANPPEQAQPSNAPTAAAQEKKEPPPKSGATLKGRVLGSDRKTPLPAAIVHAIRPDGTINSSAPADEKGNYVLGGLPPGTYTLAVSVHGDLYSLESPVGVTSAQTFSVDLATVPAEAAAPIPLLEGTPRGFCYIVQGKRPEGTSFWRSPKGIVVLAVTAGAVGLILAGSGKSDEENSVSPSVP